MIEPAEFRVVEIADERSELSRRALELIIESIGDVQPLEDLLSELEERRLGLPSGGNYHLLALLGPDDDRPMAAAAGVYLQGVNAGFITYLAVRSDQRGRRLGRELRAHLVQSFRADAERLRGSDLAWTVGEVRRESAWLRTLVQDGRAIPLDLRYLHPWMSRRADRAYVLYREPVGDKRPEMPAEEARRLVYAIWQRAYRIRFPLQSDTFRYMLRQLEGRETVGADPDFLSSSEPG